MTGSADGIILHVVPDQFVDFVCKKIPADKDSKELRKRIADELLRCARSGRHTLVELQKAGMTIVNETSKPARSGWFRW
jgi:hypothetical protein